MELNTDCNLSIGNITTRWFPTDDDDKLVPTPESDKVKRWELSPSISLHRLPEAQLSKEITALLSASVAQSVKETEKAPRCEKVLSRLFEVGRLLIRRENEAYGSPTRFIVVRALGPPDRVGLWIIALPPWKYEMAEDYESDLGTEEDMSDSATAEMRKERLALLDGFPEPISYARIKEDGQGEKFDLKDSAASSFVLCLKHWYAE